MLIIKYAPETNMRWVMATLQFGMTIKKCVEIVNSHCEVLGKFFLEKSSSEDYVFRKRFLRRLLMRDVFLLVVLKWMDEGKILL